MKKLELTEAQIRAHATEKVFERGVDYERKGLVSALVWRGGELQAEVQGSEPTPYRVRVAFEEDGAPRSARCSCPYDWGGWCKHIVAVLLAALKAPERVEERPTLEELLARLDATALRELLLDLAARRPRLVEEIESRLALQEAETTPADSGAVDVRPLRRRVQAILHSLDHLAPSEAYWQVGGVVEDLRAVLEEIEAVVARREGQKALRLLEAFTDEYAEGWTWLDASSGESYEVFFDLAPVWMEALLTADLTEAERETWVEKLEGWQKEIGLYGLEDVFPVAQAAARWGWDAPPDEQKDYWYDELTAVKLDVLERREAFDAFLQLAEIEGRHSRRAAVLAQLGRLEEAERIGLSMLESAEEALEVARVLDEKGATGAALDVAERGLDLGGYGRRALAAWLRDRAAEEGLTERALQAARVVFRAQPDLESFRKVETLAGDHWPEHRAELLEHLRKYVANVSPPDAVDVFLYEGCVEDAIIVIEKGYVDYEVLRRVADAAVSERPAWVIETARREAEKIMEAGRSNAYRHAVNWLAKARDAYRMAGREDEWRAYRKELLDKHQRKYKLRPMLEQL